MHSSYRCRLLLSVVVVGCNCIEGLSLSDSRQLISEIFRSTNTDKNLQVSLAGKSVKDY
jgi:hypothetical protein